MSEKPEPVEVFVCNALQNTWQTFGQPEEIPSETQSTCVFGGSQLFLWHVTLIGGRYKISLYSYMVCSFSSAEYRQFN